ncbi:hypothetical protein [Archangium sp.]|uniref:hypothetical protein n=1 Tax=Archangium sp. TaxID=1872627 RepID=UPI00286C7323|nr:hypothetical protein [Archangium sp.]
MATALGRVIYALSDVIRGLGTATSALEDRNPKSAALCFAAAIDCAVRGRSHLNDVLALGEARDASAEWLGTVNHLGADLLRLEAVLVSFGDAVTASVDRVEGASEWAQLVDDVETLESRVRLIRHASRGLFLIWEGAAVPFAPVVYAQPAPTVALSGSAAFPGVLRDVVQVLEQDLAAAESCLPHRGLTPDEYAEDPSAVDTALAGVRAAHAALREHIAALKEALHVQ